MKKISIIALHLGFGGAEQCICNLANNLINDYEVEIISVYKLYDQPAFKLNKNIKITYLIENHKPNKDKWLNALKKLKLIPFIKESYNSVITLFLKKHNTIKAIKNCQSNIIISSKFLFNKWVGKYASKEIYKIAWEHNHYHGNIKYAKNVINSCKNMDKLILVSNSLKDFYSFFDPIFKNNPNLIYLDNGATSHKPQEMINSISDYYSHDNSNIGRGVYKLAEKSQKLFDNARKELFM